MKIGILSMQRIYNYGSWLQAYGLKKLIEENRGVSVEFVDYRIEKPVYENGFNHKNYWIQKIKVGLIDFIASVKPLAKIMPDKDFYQTYRFRHEYWKKLGLSKKPNYTPELDILFVGSDEVFNCLQENVRVGYSDELLGANNKAKMLATYAASFGNTTVSKIDAFGKRQEISSYLKAFDMISVRDNNALAVVTELTGTTPVSNMDPVLMYDFSEEMQSCTLTSEQKMLMSKPYMIVYAYPNRLQEAEITKLKKFAKDNGLLIYGISGYQSYADEMIYDSPLNILQYFKHARYVVTDTFHGTIFSVINNRPFVTLVRKSVNGSYGNQEKLEDLLKKLELNDRFTFEGADIVDILETPISYDVTNQIIQAERQRTKDYLSEVIDEYKNRTVRE